MQHLRKVSDITTAIADLTARDPILARAYEIVGVPPLRHRAAGFTALVSLMIGQQVSTAAARAIEGRLYSAVDGKLTPQNYHRLAPTQLRTIGLSAQKQKYITALADAIAGGVLNPRTFGQLSDNEVYARLTALPGIGAWTAQNYLMFSLSRADIFPAGDLALQEGYRLLAAIDTRPNASALATHAQKWRPLRSAAALLIWRYYRHCKQKTRIRNQ